MEVSFMDVIKDPEAPSLHEAFDISHERADEIVESLKRVFKDYVDTVIKNKKNMTKADVFMFLIREGLTPANPQELCYITHIVAEKMTQMQISYALKARLPQGLSDLVLAAAGLQDEGDCMCEDCKRRRAEQGESSEDDE